MKGDVVMGVDGRAVLPARSVYELRVVEDAVDDRVVHGLIDVVADVVLQGTGEVTGGVTLQIIDRRSHKVVMSMREHHDSAGGVAELIAADLDRLDPTAFAREWGFDRDGASTA